MTNEVLLAATRNDFMTFIQRALRHLEPGTTLVPGFHIEAMAGRLEDIRTGRLKRLTIAIAPRALKSVCASVAFVAFALGHHPGMKIICASYSHDLATKLGRDCRRIMESSWYRQAFPDTVISKCAEDILETTLGGQRLATSIGGPLTGFGADILIIDDPQKPEDAASQAARDKVNRVFRETMLSRLQNKVTGRVIIVMQRLHDDDLIGHVTRDNGDWYKLILPAIAQTDEQIELGRDIHGNRRFHLRRKGDLLLPEREPLETLEAQKRAMGSAAFASQWLQDPQPAGGLMVRPKWLRTYIDLPARSDGRIIQSWDTALKDDSAHDYSVCTTWLEIGTDHYLLDVDRRKLEFPFLLKHARNLYQQHQPDCVLVEDKGSGTSLIQMLKTLPDINAVIPINAKDDKVTRLNRVLPIFEAGQIYLPKDASWRAELVAELLGFPNGRYDDQVDSVSQYLSWATQRGPSFTSDFSYWI